MVTLDYNPLLWLMMIGIDGGAHRIPRYEEHEPHYSCVCNPVQYISMTGGHLFIHRVLSC